MARGWESKAIEAQQEAATETGRRKPLVNSAIDKPLDSARGRPIDAGRLRERATLMLARTRALTDLQAACAPAYRAMLEQMITDLDRRIKDIETQ
jgi:hypothetical protein